MICASDDDLDAQLAQLLTSSLTPPAPEPVAPIVIERHAVASPTHDHGWFGQKPPVACAHRGGSCGYTGCAGQGSCLMLQPPDG
jgi:hypothetical protein